MTTAKAQKSSFADLFKKVKDSKAVNFINKLLSSQWGLIFYAVMTMIAFTFKIELLLYSVVLLVCLFICLFGQDFLPIAPLFVFCYISPSIGNNPGRDEGSFFYGGQGIATLVIVCICFAAMITRIALDKNLGFKKLFCHKRALLWGFLALGLAYFLSGIASSHYPKIVGNNLIVALLQFISLFLLYFLFGATINWQNTDKKYFAYLGLIMGLVVAYELLLVYLTKGIYVNGEAEKDLIFVGWGMSNNIGAMLAMSIPFAFWLACKEKHCYIYLALATILALATVASASRTSLLAVGVIYITCLIITCIKAENKKVFRLSDLIGLGSLLVIGGLLTIILWDKITALLPKIKAIFVIENGKIIFIDSNRFLNYTEGLKSFLKNPIFGESFFQIGFSPYQFSRIETFSSLLPPRWHNTIVQLLASCGIVGIVAYGYHRYQTVALFVKNPNLDKTFIGLSLLTFIGMSLLDCHFFNLGPTMIYSLLLAVSENLYNEQAQAATSSVKKLKNLI